VTNAEFTKALGAAVHRPTVLPTPLAPLKVVYGPELVQRVLVEGQRVLPAGLEASGYRFRHPTIAEAFDAALA
jgi:NAD dependent epimerase/dehydratase family enzyme